MLAGVHIGGVVRVVVTRMPNLVSGEPKPSHARLSFRAETGWVCHCVVSAHSLGLRNTVIIGVAANEQRSRAQSDATIAVADGMCLLNRIAT